MLYLYKKGKLIKAVSMIIVISLLASNMIPMFSMVNAASDESDSFKRGKSGEIIKKKKIEDKEVEIIVKVSYDDLSPIASVGQDITNSAKLSCDDIITAGSTEFELSVTSEAEKFEKKISTDEIKIFGAFEGMKVTTVNRVDDKNVKLKLNGTMKEVKAGDKGNLTFSKSCFINDKIGDSSVVVNVSNACAEVKISNIKSDSLKDGKFTIPIVITYANIDEEANLKEYFVLENGDMSMSNATIADVVKGDKKVSIR